MIGFEPIVCYTSCSTFELYPNAEDASNLIEQLPISFPQLRDELQDPSTIG